MGWTRVRCAALRRAELHSVSWRRPALLAQVAAVCCTTSLPALVFGPRLLLTV